MAPRLVRWRARIAAAGVAGVLAAGVPASGAGAETVAPVEARRVEVIPRGIAPLLNGLVNTPPWLHLAPDIKSQLETAVPNVMTAVADVMAALSVLKES